MTTQEYQKGLVEIKINKNIKISLIWIVMTAMLFLSSFVFPASSEDIESYALIYLIAVCIMVCFLELVAYSERKELKKKRLSK